jgi:hypothetical protein
MKDEKKIESVQDFLDKLETLEIPNETELFFRGETKKRDTNNQASIFREDYLIKNEHKIFRDFILRNPDEFTSDMTVFEKLAKMQHHDLPTRLLDVSSNPLVSLYFACENYKGAEDGIITVFKVPKDEIKYFDSREVEVISNIALMKPESFDNPLMKKEVFKKFEIHQNLIEKMNNSENGENTEIELDSNLEYFNLQVKMLLKYSDLKQRVKELDSLQIIGDIGNTFLVKHLQSNRRIIMQSGAFIIFGASRTKETKLKPSPIFCNTETIIIDKSQKQKILNQLEKLGISQDRIYPEMDKVADYIKNKYKNANTSN